jgi:hypothetical protein
LLKKSKKEEMNLFDEFFKIIGSFEEIDLKYAVVGGIAMAFHDQPRFTKDIDILVLPEDLGEIAVIFEKIGYFESSDPWTFKNTNLTLHRFMKVEGGDFLTVDILAGSDDKYRKVVNNALLEKSEKGVVKIANKNDLIWMKEMRNSDQDKVDIKRLANDKD